MDSIDRAGRRYLRFFCGTAWVILLMSSVVLWADSHTAQRNRDDPNRILRSSLNTSVTTLDPAIAYDWANYQLGMFLGCRLLTIAKHSPNTEKVLAPQLASDYAVSPDHKTYTFTLNKDWYFHNGRRVEAGDVKYTLERILDKKTGSPGANFLSGIVGEQAYNAGKAEHITGIEVLGAHRLRITLGEARLSFLFGLTTNFGSIVAREDVIKGDSDKRPIGCGPFKVESFADDLLVLATSPYHPNRDFIYWNKITYTLNEDHKKSALRLLRGQLDLVQSVFTTALEANPSNNPDLTRRMVKLNNSVVFNTIFLSLNRRQPALSDLRVRQAINMAIDKEGIIELFIQDAAPATQILPPGMAGYDPDQQGYVYDPVAARALLKEAGFEQGFTVELLVLDKAWIRGVARTIQNNLLEVGIRVEIRPAPLEEYLKRAADPEKAGMVFSEGVAWRTDYPDPSNYYWPLFSKNSIRHGWNWAYHENADIDRLARLADSFVAPEQHEQRVAGWRHVYRELHKAVPWVPLYHNAAYLLKSPEIKYNGRPFGQPVSHPSGALKEPSLLTFEFYFGDYFMFSYREPARR